MRPNRGRYPPRTFRGRPGAFPGRVGLQRPPISGIPLNIALLTRPKPKPIKTIELTSSEPSGAPPQTTTTATTYSKALQSDEKKSSTSSNFCASWLAKNARLARPKAKEVMLDDRDGSTIEDGEIVMLSDNRLVDMEIDEKEEESESVHVSEEVKELPRTSATETDVEPEVIQISDDDNDSVIFLEDVAPPKRRRSFGRQKKRNQARNMACQESTSSESFESVAFIDGYSKYCFHGKRAGAARLWHDAVPAQSPRSEESSCGAFSDITICSYNVLCQKTIERTDYLYRHLTNALHLLQWNYRSEGLKLELPQLGADILGLQEVQDDHFGTFYEPLMAQNGYQGTYKRKFGTTQKDDGCALFWRHEKFDKLREDGVNYFVSTSAISNRENIGQIVTLRCKTTAEVVIVANTHLLFNTERGDVKLAQLAILFANIHRVKGEIEQFGYQKPIVVVMGDFNIEPHSKVYDFVVTGSLKVDKMAVRTMSGQSYRSGGLICSADGLLKQTQVGMDSIFRAPGSPCPAAEKFLRHPFHFVSAYHHRQPLDEYDRRPISTYHKDAASPDFIFYTPEENQQRCEKFQLLARYTLPTYDTLHCVTPWPNQHVPSDHLPIMAKFRLFKGL